jgi:hypothetical protein
MLVAHFKLKSTPFIPDPKLEWLRSGEIFIGQEFANRPGIVRLMHPLDPEVFCELPRRLVDEVS